jgi:hypothetical protein
MMFLKNVQTVWQLCQYKLLLPIHIEQVQTHIRLFKENSLNCFETKNVAILV